MSRPWGAQTRRVLLALHETLQASETLEPMRDLLQGREVRLTRGRGHLLLRCRYRFMNNRERSERVRRQIRIRLETLRKWSSDGVPAGQALPGSLNQLRRWEAPALRICPIGSSSTFTTTHPEHGPSVRKLSEILDALIKRQRASQPDETSAVRRLAEERARVATLRKMFEDSADLYAKLTVELDEALRDLRVTRQSYEALQAKVSEFRQDNHDLRRRLARYSNSEVVTDLRPRGPG